MSQGVDAFLLAMRARGVKLSTERTCEFRLRALLDLETIGADLTWRLTPARAQELYRKRVEVTRADTHRGELVTAKAFGAWGKKQGWFKTNPFELVDPVGKKSKGRPQLRVDEARRFLAAAIAERSKPGLAAALTLMLGLRASECADRIVRDVDDGGRLLWISHAKTAAGVRTLAVPAILVEQLAELAAGRPAEQPLWGDVDRYWLLYHVIRICEAAKVPRVTPQGLRGLHATLAIDGGAHIEQVARSMGHASVAVTRRHYIGANVEQNAQTRNVVAALASSDRSSHDSSQDDPDPSEDPATN